jgi:hypothetical protein
LPLCDALRVVEGTDPAVFERMSGVRSSLRNSREQLHRWSLHRISSDAVTIKAVQRFRTPFLDALFRFISMFADEVSHAA